MKKRSVKIVALLLTLVMVFSLAGCGKKNGGKTVSNESPTKGETQATATPAGDKENSGETKEKTYDEFLTVDVFATEANYEGLQPGWFAKVVKDKFNMELNIISPNVSGGGDTLFTTRSAAGNLGDIIIVGSENGRLQNCVTAGLLYDITDLVNSSEVFSQYSLAVDKVKGLVSDGKVYAIPKQVSAQAATEPSETIDLAFGAFIRWDYYIEAGAPKLNTLEDLLPLMKKIQTAHPTTDSGRTAYGFSLFKDWDGNMMNLAQQPARMYGYDEVGFVLHKADGSDYDSVIDNDSIYVRGLKFFFNANQEGVLDPESTTQNWDTLWSKYVDGAVYFSPWSWQGQSAFNTPDNVNAGKGFKFVPINDFEILSTGAMPSGDKAVIAVGSKAKDPERMFDFIEWLYSPEGILANCSPDSGAPGPEGLTWEYVDGKSRLTDFGKKVFADPENTIMPDDWNGGTWRDGTSALNYRAVLETDINPNTGEAYGYKNWASYITENSNPVDTSWQEYFKVNTMVDLVKSTGNLIVSPGTSFINPEEGTEITALRNQCKEKIVDYSWRMCFASSEEEFNKLLKEMQETVKGLGYDDVLAYDMQVAKDKDAARAAARVAK